MKPLVAFLAGLAAAAVVAVAIDHLLNPEQYSRPFVGERPC